MACGCGKNNNLQRTLYYPVSELDKLENGLIKKAGYRLEAVPDWQSFSFLSSYSSFNPASQTVLASVALKLKHESASESNSSEGHLSSVTQEATETEPKADRLISICFLAGIQYPLLVYTLTSVDIPDEISQKAIANLLTDFELIEFIKSSLG